MISLPPRVPSPHQTFRLMLFLMNFTLPSAISTFTPPGWALATPTVQLLSGQLLIGPPLRQPPYVSLGCWIVLNIENPELPSAQVQPLKSLSVVALVKSMAHCPRAAMTCLEFVNAFWSPPPPLV